MSESAAFFVRRIALEHTGEDARILDGQSKICAWAFNQLKALADDLRAGYARLKAARQVEPARRHAELDASAAEIAQVLYTKRGLRNLLPAMKTDHPFLKAVHSSPLKNAALRLSRAVQSYQDSRSGRRQGPEVRWPRFHRWGMDWFSLEYDEPGKGFSFEEGNLHLSLGANAEGKRLALELPLRETVPGLAVARNLRIVKEGCTYCAVVTLQRSMPVPKPIRKAVALDPNHKNFAYAVDTEGKAVELQNLEGLRETDRRIDTLKAMRDRCQRKSRLVEVVRQDQTVGRHWEPSRRWNRSNQTLKRAEQKRRDQTKHFLFSISNKLCKNYDLIGVGDYAPSQGDAGFGAKMNRAMQNRSLLGRFKAILTWVARRSGKAVDVFDETGTTRTCSEPDCGQIVQGGIPPKLREWTCAQCGTHYLRDENAAKNGLVRILRSRSLHLPCSGPVQGRCDWRFHPQGWREVPKGSANANQTGCPASTGPAEEAVYSGSVRGVMAPDLRLHKFEQI
jgi:putative transposase